VSEVKTIIKIPLKRTIPQERSKMSIMSNTHVWCCTENSINTLDK